MTNKEKEVKKKKKSPKSLQDTAYTHTFYETEEQLSTMSTTIQLDETKKEAKRAAQERIDNLSKQEFEKLVNTPIAQLPEYETKFLMLRRINTQTRKKKGLKLKPLIYDERLELVAQDFLYEVNDIPRDKNDKENDHKGKNGEKIVRRLKKYPFEKDINYHEIKTKKEGRVTKYITNSIGENISYSNHQSTIQSLMTGFEKSPDHYKALINPYVSAIGIGYFPGANRLVQVFADFKN